MIGQQQMDEPQGEEPPVDGEENSENGPGSDVKKYSGELSQALNAYNEENPNHYDVSVLYGSISANNSFEENRP